MKKFYSIVFVALVIGFSSCNKAETKEVEEKDVVKNEEVSKEEKEETPSTFGVAVDEAVAFNLVALDEQMSEKDSVDDVTVQATVKEVCQNKGCWMTLEKEDGNTVRVTFKDYALFMPKDLAGKQVVVHGVAKNSEISVETLKHLAEDAGKSEEEIAKISEPEMTVAIVADGVKIQN